MMLCTRTLAVLSLAVLSSACGSSSSSDEGTSTSGGSSSGGSGSGGTPGDGGATSTTGGSGGLGGLGGDGPLVPPEEGACVPREGVCELSECSPTLQGADHATPCTVLTFSSNPPTSGTHYDVWAKFAKYTEPVPRGFLLHSLEHSGVVLSYNCDEATTAGLDCNELISDIEALYDAWPEDPLCAGTGSPHRLIITPDPDLDAPFAVSAWGHYLKGACFDESLVTRFIQAHYGQNYENFCSGGVDPLGGSYPEDCGQ